MNLNPKKLEDGVKMLFAEQQATVIVLAAMASLLNTAQINLLRDRLADLAAKQELVGGEESTELVQGQLQPRVDKLFVLLLGAQRQYHQ